MNRLLELLLRALEFAGRVAEQAEARKRSKIQRDRYVGKAAGEAAHEASKKAGK